MFDAPELLSLFAILPILTAVFIWRSKVYKTRLSLLADEALLPEIVTGRSFRTRIAKFVVFCTYIACIILALARPVWGVTEQITAIRGISVMVVLDVSASMDAEDILPSRLDRAKLAIRELFANRQGDEVGLVLFAGNAFVQVPLTTDVISATNFVNAASTTSITNQGTAVGEALSLAIRTFDAQSLPFSTVILMTDGENHEGDPLNAATELGELGVPVHVIGYGNPIDGVPIPIRSEDGELQTYKSDRVGNLVLTRLDETVLQEIADLSGGTYQRATESGIEVIDLINTINAIDGGTLEEQSQIRQVARFGIPVALALLLLTVEMLLPERRGE